MSMRENEGKEGKEGKEQSILRGIEKMSQEIKFTIYEYLMPHVKIDIFKCKYTNLQMLMLSFVSLTEGEGDELEEKREMMMGLYHRHFGKNDSVYDCRYNGFTDCDNNYFHYYPRQRFRIRGGGWYTEDVTDYNELIEELLNSIHRKEGDFRRKMEHLDEFPESTIMKINENDVSNIRKIYKLYCDFIYANKIMLGLDLVLDLALDLALDFDLDP